LIPTAAAQDRSDSSRFNGPVKTVVVQVSHFEASYPDTFTELPKVTLETRFYNMQGQNTREVGFGSDGKVLWTWEGVYSSDGALIREYDRDADGSTRLRVRVQDSRGHYGIDEYSDDGDLKRSWRYTLDERGNVRISAQYDGHGVPMAVEQFFYDQKGRKLRMSHNGVAPAHVPNKYIIDFDAHGRPLRRRNYETSRGGYLGKVIYEYDSIGNLTRERFYGINGSEKRRLVHTYDEFDRYANWTKMTTYEEEINGSVWNRNPIKTTYRTIEYY
jgi:hypothetical protein